MGDAINRKTAAVTRLRQLLKKKREALADQFDFKIYMIFHFKNQVRHVLSLDAYIHDSDKNKIIRKN